MNDELREALSRFGVEWDNEQWGHTDEEEREWYRGHFADAVLALPEIAALRAKADAADRVRQLCAEALDRAYASDADVLVSDVLDTLDGDQS